MRIPRYTLLVLALAALLALLAGCGGGGDSTESTASTTTEAPPPLSKADLIEQGDAICGEVNAAVGSLTSSESPSAGEGTQVPNLYVGMVEDIEGLGTPSDTAGYPEFSEAAEELAKIEGEVKLAVEREDSVALSEAETEAAAALSQFQTRAEAYGFQRCGEGPSAPTANPGVVTPGGEEGEAVEEGGVEAEEPEYAEPEYAEPEPEEPAPETGGAGGEGVAPEGGGTEGGGGEGAESGGSSGGVGPG